MRLTGGDFSGRNLKEPKNGLTHPMGSRGRLALFNALFNVVSGVRTDDKNPFSGICVLDAYAGTGALGFEALSRGAESATFLEKDPVAVKTIKENAAALNLTAKCQIFKVHVQDFIAVKDYDLIFIDPPYDRFHPEEFAHFFAAAQESPASKPVIIALSHPATFDPHTFPGLLSTKSYAAARISIYRAA